MIEKIGIIGAGAMGSSIAEVFAYNGYSVYLKDQNADYVNKGISHARKVLDDFQSYVNSLPEKEIKRIEKNGIELNEQQKSTIEKNLARKIDIDKIIYRIHPVESYNDLSQCGLIIEAVFEKQEIKNNLFRDLSEAIGENTIVASNTSSLCQGQHNPPARMDPWGIQHPSSWLYPRISHRQFPPLLSLLPR